MQESPAGMVKYKAIAYGAVPFTKGAIVTLHLNRATSKSLEDTGYLIATVKKVVSEKPTIENTHPKGLLLKYKDKVLTFNRSPSRLSKCTSDSARSAIVECVSEVLIKNFNPVTYETEAEIIPGYFLSETEEKEYKSLLIDQMDKILNKIGNEITRIDEYNGISTLAELTDTVYLFLKSYGGIDITKGTEYLNTSDLKKRVDILIESASSFYFKYNPADFKLPDRNKMPVEPETYSNIAKYEKLIDSIKSLDESIKEELRRRLKYLQRSRGSSAEASNLTEYFETLCQIPWDTYSQQTNDLKKMREDFENNQFGMNDAKERLFEYIAANINRGEESGTKVLCLIGSPGTGKTLFAQNIAKVLNRKFTSIALGGANDVTILRGQRKGWVGAEPGQIVKALIRAKTMDPVIILDEIDKIGGNFSEQVKAALLEILDPNQNCEFRDNYLDIPIDISKILFVASGNYLSGISLPLQDRMEMIQIPAYTSQEKIEISKKFTIPKLLSDKNLKESDLSISDEVIYKVVENFKYDPGMRKIKQTYEKIINKFLLNKYEGRIEAIDNKQYVITTDVLEDYIKLHNVTSDYFDPKASLVGEINMLWTTADDTGFTVGGGRSVIQVRYVDGKGDNTMTGSLSNVLKQSVTTSISYLRTKTSEMSIDSNYFQKHDLIIHFPSIARPKDGPSAGVAITLGMISAIKGLPVQQNMGVTGEMDLSGRVLPVGGIKTKVISGLQAGITIFLIPLANKSEFENDLGDDIKKQVDVHFYEHISEAIKVFFPDTKINL